MPGKMARSDPRPSVRVTRGAGSGKHLASVLQEGRKNANIDAGLGFIWRISVYVGICLRRQLNRGRSVREADIQTFWQTHPCGQRIVEEQFRDDYETFFRSYDAMR